MSASTTYFSLFGLSEHLEVGDDALNTAYRTVQSQAHPDRYAHAGDAERHVATQWATHANEAYQALRDPLKRTMYLLRLRGIDVQAENNTATPPAFLMQQMEWCEALGDVKAERNVDALDDLLGMLRKEKRTRYRAPSGLLNSDGNTAAAANAVRQLVFIEKIERDIVETIGRLDDQNPELATMPGLPRQAAHSRSRDIPTTLLQTSEPSESPAPHQRRLTVGIDLGTANSSVTSVRSSVPEVLPDDQGHPLSPSMVRYLPTDGAHIGYEAQTEAVRDPKNTIISVKCFMGRGLKDAAHIENMPYDFVDTPGMIQLKTVAGVKSPVEVLAEILVTLRQRAEDTLGGELVGAVITVPAYFDGAQRQATKDAAKLAGLNVLHLLSEPTAVAIACGLDNAAEDTCAVYDLGGGTFDTSVFKLTKGAFKVTSTDGDSALGGNDFDQRIVCWVVEQAGLQPLFTEDTRLLLNKAQAAKEWLSTADSTEIDAMLPTGETVHLVLTAETLAELTTTLVQKTLSSVRRALRGAGVTVGDVKGVVLVGGATRMPIIRRAVGQLFGQTPLTNLDPDQVVAIDIAMQANLLAGNRASGEDRPLFDAIPLSLGIETMGGPVEKIIPHNSTIPVACAQESTTSKDGQAVMAIHVLQGGRELANDCRSLARFELRGIPPMVVGAVCIRVTYQVDADGLLSVSTRETVSGVEASITVKPSYGLANDDVARMLQEGFQSAGDDTRRRTLAEERVEAERLFEVLSQVLAADGDLLSPEKRATIDAKIVALRTTTQGEDHRAIKDTVDTLSHDIDEFAMRHMDRGIRKAPVGKRIGELD